MIELKLLDGTVLKTFPSASIIVDFEPTFGVSLEKVGSEPNEKNALKGIMLKFAFVLWRGNFSACIINGTEPRFKNYEALLEITSPTELLKKGGALLLAINKVEDLDEEKKNE